MGFRLRLSRASDLPRLVEIFNAQSYYPNTVEEARRTEANRRPEDWHLRLVAETPDGVIAGYGVGFAGLGQRPGEVNIRIRVDAPYRGRGAGRLLYAEVERWALALSPVACTSAVREIDAESVSWAQRLGFAVEHHLFRSKLDLHTWDPAPFMGAVHQAEARGIQLSDLSVEIQGEETYRRFYEFIGPLIADMPGGAGRTARWATALPVWPGSTGGRA